MTFGTDEKRHMLRTFRRSWTHEAPQNIGVYLRDEMQIVKWKSPAVRTVREYIDDHVKKDIHKILGIGGGGAGNTTTKTALTASANSIHHLYLMLDRGAGGVKKLFAHTKRQRSGVQPISDPPVGKFALPEEGYMRTDWEELVANRKVTRCEVYNMYFRAAMEVNVPEGKRIVIDGAPSTRIHASNFDEKYFTTVFQNATEKLHANPENAVVMSSREILATPTLSAPTVRVVRGALDPNIYTHNIAEADLSVFFHINKHIPHANNPHCPPGENFLIDSNDGDSLMLALLHARDRVDPVTNRFNSRVWVYLPGDPRSRESHERRAAAERKKIEECDAELEVMLRGINDEKYTSISTQRKDAEQALKDTRVPAAEIVRLKETIAVCDEKYNALLAMATTPQKKQRDAILKRKEKAEATLKEILEDPVDGRDVYVNINKLYLEIEQHPQLSMAQYPQGMAVLLYMLSGSDFFDDYAEDEWGLFVNMGWEEFVWNTWCRHADRFRYMLLMTYYGPTCYGQPELIRHPFIDEECMLNFIYQCYGAKYGDAIRKKNAHSGKLTVKMLEDHTRAFVDNCVRKNNEKDDAYAKRLKLAKRKRLPNRGVLRRYVRLAVYALGYSINDYRPGGSTAIDPLELYEGYPYYGFIRDPENPTRLKLADVCSIPKPIPEHFADFVNRHLRQYNQGGDEGDERQEEGDEEKKDEDPREDARRRKRERDEKEHQRAIQDAEREQRMRDLQKKQKRQQERAGGGGGGN